VPLRSSINFSWNLLPNCHYSPWLPELRRLVLVCRVSRRLRKQMPVGVEGDLDTGVAHRVADVLGTLSLRNEHRREEVPKVVEANVEAGVLEDGSKIHASK
jgi:hypothetical protein